MRQGATIASSLISISDNQIQPRVTDVWYDCGHWCRRLEHLLLGCKLSPRRSLFRLMLKLLMLRSARICLAVARVAAYVHIEAIDPNVLLRKSVSQRW